MKTKTIAYVMVVLGIIPILWAVSLQEALIDYYLNNVSYFREGQNSIKFYCKNAGEQDELFSRIVTFVNATFSTQTEKPYTLVNDRTVKFSYLLHKGNEANRYVSFSIDENVAGFSISLSLEQITFPMKSNSFYPTKLSFRWNKQTEQYVSIE